MSVATLMQPLGAAAIASHPYYTSDIKITAFAGICWALHHSAAPHHHTARQVGPEHTLLSCHLLQTGPPWNQLISYITQAMLAIKCQLFIHHTEHFPGFNGG